MIPRNTASATGPAFLQKCFCGSSVHTWTLGIPQSHILLQGGFLCKVGQNRLIWFIEVGGFEAPGSAFGSPSAKRLMRP